MDNPGPVFAIAGAIVTLFILFVALVISLIAGVIRIIMSKIL